MEQIWEAAVFQRDSGTAGWQVRIWGNCFQKLLRVNSYRLNNSGRRYMCPSFHPGLFFSSLARNSEVLIMNQAYCGEEALFGYCNLKNLPVCQRFQSHGFRKMPVPDCFLPEGRIWSVATSVSGEFQLLGKEKLIIELKVAVSLPRQMKGYSNLKNKVRFSERRRKKVRDKDLPEGLQRSKVQWRFRRNRG